MSTKQLCTVLIDRLRFGIEVEFIQEVLRSQWITGVPLASSEVVGLINLRGQIVTAIDLRQRLGLPNGPDRREMLNVVVRHQGSIISFLVDDIGDVIDVPESQFEATPEALPARVRGFISGIYKLDGGLLLLLNTIKAIQPEA